MRKLETTEYNNIPKEIALQQNELLHLIAAVPDQDEAIKLAYAAGVHAMGKINEVENNDFDRINSDYIDKEVRYAIILNRDLLVGLMQSCFDERDFNGSLTEGSGSLEDRVHKAADWAVKYYSLLNAAISLVAENLDKLDNSLELHF
ncbi:MAG: hypothetical protein K5771_01715 [Oscillospiraceae bacterium]|nr:hypothetical protein [Oscillospiraceae bacterium]